jgi:hypothetical protein
VANPAAGAASRLIGVARNLGEVSDHHRLAPAAPLRRGHGGPETAVELATELLDQELLVLRDVDVPLGQQHVAVSGPHA